jgi:hypothetical protein
MQNPTSSKASGKLIFPMNEHQEILKLNPSQR